MDNKLGKNLFEALVKKHLSPQKTPIPKLVIGINQVDNLATPSAPWLKEYNMPSVPLEKKIQKRVDDIIEKLTTGPNSASKNQIEYFSALKAYRLPAVINKIVTNCNVMSISFNPKEMNDPECAEGMTDAVRHAIDAKLKAERAKFQKHGMDEFIARLMSQLDTKEAKRLEEIIKSQKAKPVKIAVIGQAGVGKSFTVNNLFGAKFKVSRTKEGTDENNFVGYKDYELPDGSIISVADLPGYGFSLDKDEKYTPIYIDTLKGVDIILLIIQANRKSIEDDQKMVEHLFEWSKEGLI